MFNYVIFSEKIPEMYKNMGLKDAKIFMANSVLKKLKRKHHLTDEMIKDVKKAIENPVAIMKIDRKLLVVTDLKDFENSPVIAILGTTKEEERLDGNFIMSVYGRKNIVNYMYNQVSDSGASVMFMDFDKIEYLKRFDTQKRLNEIKRMVLESKGCKLRMTIERDGKKVELTESEIWAAYSLVSNNLTAEDLDLVKEIERER